MDEYERAIATTEGSLVANHLLRELIVALGESLHARPQAPQEVWDEMLAKVRGLSDKAKWPKRRCSSCGREVAVNMDGNFRWHHSAMGGPLCPASRTAGSDKGETT